MQRPRREVLKYWTRAKVIDAFKRYYRLFNAAPRSSDVFCESTAGMMSGTHRSFPPKGVIFQHFESMYEAWKATGIEAALPHCDCGALLPAYHKRCCADCKPKRMSAGIKRGWAGKRKYKHTDETDAEIIRVYTETKRSSKAPRIKPLAEQLGFPRHVVSQRASVLGLTPNKKAPNWSPEELDLVEKLSYLAVGAIRRKLKKAGYDRSETAINLVIKRLSLRADLPFYTGNQLANCLGEDGHLITKWATEGVIPFVSQETTRRGPQHGDIRLFHEVDVYIFLVSNRDLYDLRKVNKDWLLEMLVDFPSVRATEIAARRAEQRNASPLKPPQYPGCKWRERKKSMYKRSIPTAAIVGGGGGRLNRANEAQQL